ncbi:MAG: DUF3568 family protein [Candidatus Omnitrophota bacterium]|nr:DUF3568 family protein [Candidatus Omnitrophota bacterium]MDZ4241782.1 DUF3568 family protein [Candidatus Omnitrophota bacterium]
MFKMMKNSFMPMLLVGCLMSAAGCVPLILGAAAGAGGYAYVRGILVKQYEVPADQVHKAGLQGLKSLNLDIKYDKGDRLSAKIRSEFSDGKDIKIDINAITEKSAQMKIRVGMIGDKLRSEMVLTAIEKYL